MTSRPCQPSVTRHGAQLCGGFVMAPELTERLPKPDTGFCIVGSTRQCLAQVLFGLIELNARESTGGPTNHLDLVALVLFGLKSCTAAWIAGDAYIWCK